MSLKPIVSRITIYPIKGLDGTLHEKVKIAAGGCLMHDREFAMVSENGKFIVGKTNPLIHSLRSKVDFEKNILSLNYPERPEWNRFDLFSQRDEIQTYLSTYFSTPVQFVQENTGRFLDIPDYSGITILSNASLKAVSSWFDEMNLDETRRRFRASIELENVAAFWEDQLFSSPGQEIEFYIGDVKLIGNGPRERCVVPSRNPENGIVTHAFQKHFAQERAKYLPSFSKLSEYGHHYYLSVDCHIPDSEIGKWIKVGDEIIL